MTSALRAWPLLFLALPGCGADLGVGAGAMPRTGHAVGFGRLAVTNRPSSPLHSEGSWIFGMTAESRAEEQVGSRFQAGALVGYAARPYSLGSVAAPELALEAGTPLRSTLFRHLDSYFAMNTGLTFPLYHQREVQELNRSTWIVKYRVEIVPFVRVVMHNQHDAGRFERAFELSGGLAIRQRLVSDLF
jgi:hypothetical protein